ASVDARLDIHSLAWGADGNGVNLNDIVRVQVKTQQPLVADAYRVNRDTGSFILIDEATNDTVAAGMIEGGVSRSPRAARRDKDLQTGSGERLPDLRRNSTKWTERQARRRSRQRCRGKSRPPSTPRSASPGSSAGPITCSRSASRVTRAIASSRASSRGWAC